jgi:hypothetical protein
MSVIHHACPFSRRLRSPTPAGREGAQGVGVCRRCDWPIQQEEIYRFKNYDAARVHELLVLDKDPNDGTPGHFPISWCRDYGKGKVFYTALGHREDIWDGDPALHERKNSLEVSTAFQAHLLGGIEWALGIEGVNRIEMATH